MVSKNMAIKVDCHHLQKSLAWIICTAEARETVDDSWPDNKLQPHGAWGVNGSAFPKSFER
jgi:hypothetical protein